MGDVKNYIPAFQFGHTVSPGSLSQPAGMQYIRKIWWVDGTNGSDSDTGESETQAFATIQKAVDSVSSYDWIQVLPGTYRESVNTPLAGGARSVTLAGYYNGVVSENRTGIYPTDASDPAIDVRAQGWRITGFRIILASSSSGVRLRMTDAGEATGSSVAPFTTIDHNLFWLNSNGIESNGAPHGVHVVRNTFLSNTGSAIRNTDTGVKAMSDWEIRNNSFIGNTNDINLTGTCSNNIVQDNNFNDSAATRICYFEGASSANNLVTRNAFGGTYDISSGYKAGSATNIWSGNYGVAAVTSGVPA